LIKNNFIVSCSLNFYNVISAPQVVAATKEFEEWLKNQKSEGVSAATLKPQTSFFAEIMNRTKSNNQQTYQIEEEPIVLSKPLLDILLAQPAAIRSDLISLYCFYYYTAKWQKTNQPKATVEYTTNGLGWSRNRVCKIKGELIRLGLIENIVQRKERNRVIGHFVRVNFIWGLQNTYLHNMENRPVNALSSNRKKASSDLELLQDSHITPKMFERFWKIYPKHPDQGKAITAWNKLCGKKDRPTWKQVKRAVLQQKETDRWKSGFIPHPTTWLNQSRWLDDPAEMGSRTTRTTDFKEYDGVRYYLCDDGYYRHPKSGEIYFE
jgi:hypothetical protein